MSFVLPDRLTVVANNAGLHDVTFSYRLGEALHTCLFSRAVEAGRATRSVRLVHVGRGAGGGDRGGLGGAIGVEIGIGVGLDIGVGIGIGIGIGIGVGCGVGIGIGVGPEVELGLGMTLGGAA
ncbi:MAG: hypothetical protein IPG04_12830 [Polyangiaceae bacterium]|nr:hypothetical protein [Polyangiaceae bacterium]